MESTSTGHVRIMIIGRGARVMMQRFMTAFFHKGNHSLKSYKCFKIKASITSYLKCPVTGFTLPSLPSNGLVLG